MTLLNLGATPYRRQPPITLLKQHIASTSGASLATDKIDISAVSQLFISVSWTNLSGTLPTINLSVAQLDAALASIQVFAPGSAISLTAGQAGNASWSVGEGTANLVPLTSQAALTFALGGTLPVFTNFSISVIGR